MFQLRELYPLAVSRNIIHTSEYKECMQLLEFQSKDELCSKLEKIIDILSKYIKPSSVNKINIIRDRLKNYVRDMNNFNMDDLTLIVNDIEKDDDKLQSSIGRQQFREVRNILIFHHN